MTFWAPHIELKLDFLNLLCRQKELKNCYKNWYKEAVEFTEKVGTEPTMPRIALRQTLRANAPAATP